MALDGRKVNLFIVGAPKCGTTSLHNYLSHHPEIFMCPVKEPHYFCEYKSNNKKFLSQLNKNILGITKVIKDIDIYNRLFKKVSNEKIIGESSPIYLWDKQSAIRIFEYNPLAQIIILLRDPIERAYSDYLMHRKMGTEIEPSPIKAIINDYSIYNHLGVNADSKKYIDLGKYFEQINRYDKLFPKKQIKIILSKELLDNRYATLKSISIFLDIGYNYFTKLDLKEFNVALIPRNIMLKILINFYYKSNLAKYLNSYINLRIREFFKPILFKKEQKDISNDKLETIRLEIEKYFVESNSSLFENFGIKF